MCLARPGCWTMRPVARRFAGYQAGMPKSVQKGIPDRNRVAAPSKLAPSHPNN